VIVGISLVFLVCSIAGVSRGESPSEPGADTRALARFAPSSGLRQLEIERILRTVPSAEGFSKHLLYLTEEPHQTGTPRDKELADYVRDRFVEYGREEARFHDSPALMSYGRSASVEIVEPARVKLKLSEDPTSRDKDSYVYSDRAQVPFHAYASDGDVTAEVVYADAGSTEGFAKPDELGIEVAGKFVVPARGLTPQRL
jgi:N-acetylated-alpha-linked acidic dipeptidase